MRERSSRRRFLRGGLAAAAAGLAGCGGRTGTSTDRPTASATSRRSVGGSPTGAGSPGTTPTGTADPTAGLPLRLRTVADGFDAPLGLEVPPDRNDRRYVLDQTGTVHVHDADGLRGEPFLDIADRIVAGGERGLLGMAFHPRFGENRRLYVRYSAPRRAGTPSGYSHTFVLSEFRADEDGLRVEPGSERTLLEVPEPQSNHNAGSVAFGPDGHLYVGVGDGGAGGDVGRGHVEDWYDGNRGGNGQDVTENLLGSLLRIDVDAREGDKPYGIPDDNPLVGEEGLDEQYAWGFRNPWRISFDGDDLLVGDVGQSRFEEVDLVERGGNYGWNVREGAHCFGAASCPDATPDGDPLIDPVIEYPHSGAPVSGVSVIGGYVYRGSAVPALRGRYVFGDLAANGRLFVADPVEGGRWSTGLAEVAEADRDELGRILSFGRDNAGELYVAGTDGRGRGVVNRIGPGG